MIAVAFLMATIAWFGTNDATIVLNYEQGFVKILVVAAVFVLCMYYFDLYSSWVLNSPREVLTRMIQMQGTVCILLAGLYYLVPALRMSRGVLLSGFLLVAMLLVVWRSLFFTLNSLPRFAERTLILGDGPLAGPLVTELRSHPEVGLRVVGQLNTHECGVYVSAQGENEEQSEEFVNLIQTYEPQRIIVALGEQRGTLPVAALLQLKSDGVQIQDGREVYEAITGKVPLETMELSWLLFSPGFRVSPVLLFYKSLASFTTVVHFSGSVSANHGVNRRDHSTGFSRPDHISAETGWPRRQDLYALQVPNYV